MGLLDEAIREHLDLKRRRGADPTEIERLEREALGPVRRVAQEPPVAEALGAEPLDLADHPAPEEFDEGPAFGSDEDFGPEVGYEDVPEHTSDYALEPDLAEEPSPHSTGSGRPLVDPPETQGVVPPPEPVQAGGDVRDPAGAEPPVYEDVGVETAEYDVEAAHDEEDGSEDVLEETPEFLQDAPEHDRLWFEQRPPRDFDFDG
jgi:hypothetical protein